MHIELKDLFPPQREVLRKALLTRKSSCILHMSTGSGKTFLSEFAIDHVLSEGRKAIYVTPLRALAEQQAARWKNRFPDAEIGVFTGETTGESTNRSRYSRSRILIMTPERLDAAFRHWRSHWDWIPDLDLVIVDEAHILGMNARGPRLEGALTRLVRLNPFVRVLGLSATIPNADDIASWLGGSAYTSSWRHIPLEKKVVRFSSAKDKPGILFAEVKRCIDGGGQSLVFCNSRSRVQQMADHLAASGLPAAAHHAGLIREKRKSTEEQYKSGKLKVLVATSTLEMGLNLPARQVVIYDSFSFNGSRFENLPVWSFIQRAGRAGRPGLDTSGEVVLLLSKWAGESRRYLEEDCEPVESRLTDPKSLAEQILVDVFTGLSRTRGELISGFLPMTLFKRQHPNADLMPAINSLCLSGLLEEREEESPADESRHPAGRRPPGKPAVGQPSQTPRTVIRLRVSELGRLAVKMMLAPETIQIVRDALANYKDLKYFDVLLLAALSPDCSPILQANYEELDALYKRIAARPSQILDQSLGKLRRAIPGIPTTLRLLAAIKMATMLMALTDGEDAAELSTAFDCYEADIRMMSESVLRILQGVAAIDHAVKRKEKGSVRSDENTPEPESEVGSVADLAGQLQTMIKYGVPAEMVPLTRLSGVGGKTARRLVDAGYESLNDVAGADPGELVEQKICGSKLAARMVEEAYALLQGFDDTLNYSEKPMALDSTRQHSTSIPRQRSKAIDSNRQHATPLASPPSTAAEIDPYRLRRSLQLRLKGREGNIYLITGGSDDHKVMLRPSGNFCDCPDFAKGHANCKHILFARRLRGDKEILHLVKNVKEDTAASLREALPTLWFSVNEEAPK